MSFDRNVIAYLAMVSAYVGGDGNFAIFVRTSSAMPVRI